MKISSITISHHRLPLDPPFHASWDTRPRTAFDATIVRVGTALFGARPKPAPAGQ